MFLKSLNATSQVRPQFLLHLFTFNMLVVIVWYLPLPQANMLVGMVGVMVWYLPSPGQLNYVGSSHQLWHILVVLMFYWWHQSAEYIMTYRHSHPCPDYPQHT